MDLGRERVDRLALLRRHRAIELIWDLGGRRRPRLIALGLTLVSDRTGRHHVLRRHVTRLQVEAVGEEVLGHDERGGEGEHQRDDRRTHIRRPTVAGAQVAHSQIAREQPAPSPQSLNRRGPAQFHLCTHRISLFSEGRSRGTSPPLARRRDFLLSLYAWLFVVFPAANLGEDAVLLDLLIEAAKGALEGLVLADLDLGQLRCTPSDRSPYSTEV